ncbi:MAG: ABC transporter substrate-binding protein [Rhizobiales bacterium]|nr:ABC transporter substrate-binding protein [Hyphomicrobiales bacterium]
MAMTTVRKWVVAFALSVLAGSAHAANEISFYYYSVSPNNAKAVEDLIAAFEKENPDIKVKGSNKDYRTLNAEIKTALVAGNPPDVGQILTQSISDMVLNARAIPLEKSPDGAKWMERFYPSFRTLGQFKGQNYLLPFTHGVALMYYNKSLMKEAGLSPDSPPANWDELVKQAQQIKDKTGKEGVFAFGTDNDWNTQTILIAGGANILSPEGDRFTFADEKGIAALQTWQDLSKKYGLMPSITTRQALAAFNAGQLGFYIYTSAQLVGIVNNAKGNFDVGVAAVPRFGSEPLKLPNSGSGLMVFSQDPERQKNAFKFLESLSRPENSIKMSLDSGYMPVTMDPMSDPRITDFVAKVPQYSVMLDQMKVVVPKPQYPGDRAVDIQNLMVGLLDDLLAGRGTAAELAPEAQRRMNETLGQPAK